MEEGDRISILPLEIKLSILSGVEVRDAVRTSALAQSWRHLWTLLPCLRVAYIRDKLGVPGHDYDMTASATWMGRVHRLLSSLRGPIFHFELTHSGLPYFVDDQSPLFQSLLHLLLLKGGLETFHLSVEWGRAVIFLPSFSSLKRLQLYGCHVILPAAFRGFSRLTTLDLFSVKISNDDLDLLIRTSNNLTTFVKLDCVTSEDSLSVNLNFPLLRHLNFSINESVDEVSVIFAPCLEQAHISLSCTNYNPEKLARMILRLVTSVAVVSSLNLSVDVLEYFSIVALPFNFTFPRLRYLKFLLNIDTMDKKIYDAFIWLIRSMPYLEELEIELRNDDSSHGNSIAILMRELLINKHDGFACLDQTLRSVTISIVGKLDVVSSITMIQFFLLNANVLKLLKIEYLMIYEDALSMIEELQKAEVTSSDAKVVMFDRIYRFTINVK
ncbi:F-box/FBD-like domain protein [Rhynchospora pubera]|uniref:F-box/FBD-like domain protein n=1 Tax=Rhynchospora pubera TaxID=906938 RepID=A0AAV8DC77_9POAL|nr:F-box/FBD-like domain protein [Rhynchospora pubera]